MYTLEPPLLGDDDPMDDFLFDSLRGFCEHYAYAFVMMMREAGVPARIVAGYMGGEINPVNRTVIVHQFDAHAWAEVWLAEQGWVRVDRSSGTGVSGYSSSRRFWMKATRSAFSILRAS